MKDYCKDLLSCLPPKRDKMVRDMTNYLCKVREKLREINPEGTAVVELVTDSKINTGKTIHVTCDKSVSKLFEAVDEMLSRKFLNRLFILRCWALKMNWGEFYMEG